MSPHEKITHVGGYESSQWKMTLNEAIGKIESGERVFFVQVHRRTVGVIIAVSPSGEKYLKTEADSDQLLFSGSPNALNDRVIVTELDRDCGRLSVVQDPKLRRTIGRHPGPAGAGQGRTSTRRLTQRLIRHAQYVVAPVDHDPDRRLHARLEQQIRIGRSDDGVVGHDLLDSLRRWANLHHLAGE
jgi:hypothetical protein